LDVGTAQVELIEDGQGIGGGLSCSRLGLSHYVMAFEEEGNSFRLNFRGSGKAYCLKVFDPSIR
jgi:hypothetical protein